MQQELRESGGQDESFKCGLYSQVLSFYKQRLAEVRQRLAAANVGAPADPTSPSANLDADLDNISDLAGVLLISNSVNQGIRRVLGILVCIENQGV